MQKKSIVPLALVTVLATAGFSTGQITGSPHDFSRESWSQGQICLPCHAPHFAPSDDNAPLWNHELSTATYTLYSSGSLEATPGQPRGISKLCLSCHDGTVAIDSFGGQTGSRFIDGDVDFGTDLSDHHPVSFIFDDALAIQDGQLFPPSTTPSGIAGANGTIQTDMLSTNSVECSSCHDVHNAFNQEDLLVKSNDGSALCMTCHDK
jgi:predicted CXXCH cytochrome family protein